MVVERNHIESLNYAVLGQFTAAFPVKIDRNLLRSEYTVVGGLFMVEAFSVIIQVGSFRLTGKRVFRMAPLHHHFELGGWDEEKITLRFWIVGIIAGLIGVTLFLASIDRLV